MRSPAEHAHTRPRPPAPASPAPFAALLLVPFALVFLACGDSTGPVGLIGPEDEVAVVFGEDASLYPSDDWDFVAGALDGDTLVLEVRHSGGCREHGYRLLAIDDWIPFPDAGPTPTVGVPLRLSHDANGDRCEALLSPTLRFGLDPLRQAYRDTYGPGPARLLLQIPDGRDGFAIHIFDWSLAADG